MIEIKELTLLDHTPSYHDDLCYAMRDVWRDVFVSVNSDAKDYPAIDSAGVILQDNTGDKNNLFIYPNTEIASNYKRPFLMKDYQGQAVVLGNATLCTKIHAVIGFDNADVLYDAVKDDLGCVVCLPRLLERHFNALITHFGTLNKPLAVYAPLTDKDRLESLKTAVNGVLYLTIADLQTALAHDSLDDVCEQSDKVELSRIQWQTPTPFARANRNNPYPIDAFGNLADVVNILAYYAQVPPSMAGQSVLGVLSTIGQAKVNAPFSHDHKPTSLYLLTEAPSGAGKTSVQKLAYKAIFDHDRKIYQKFSDCMTEWEMMTQTLKGKELAEYKMDNPKPVNKQMMLDDATIEPILDKMVIDECDNVAWVTSEASKFFNGYTMQSSTSGNAMGHLTNLYDGGYVNRVRSQRAKDATWKTSAYDVRLTIDMSGQGAVIQPAFSDKLMSEQGFMARFLLSAEKSYIGYRDWSSDERLSANPYDDAILKGFWARCDYLLNDMANYPADHIPFTDAEPNRDRKKRFNMPFASDAMRHLAKFQQHIENSMADGQALAGYQAFASRMAENASRIATLLAYFDGKEQLTTEYLDGAFKLVQYSINEQIHYQDDNEISDAGILLNWLVKKCREKKTDRLGYSWVQSNIKPDRLNKREVLQMLTESLEYSHHIKIGFVGNTKSREIIINPLVLQGKTGKTGK